jgi:endonuclease G
VTADLSRKAALEKMFRLDEGDLLERPGHEPETPAEELESRCGYDPDFLGGWRIELPKASGDSAGNMRRLRRGGVGVELKYHNFSVIMLVSRRMPMLTAANIDGNESRRVPRLSSWSFDGRLDKEDQWGDILYYRQGIDGGHMVRREDPVWGDLEEARRANFDTFHFTNSCPQMPGVNQVKWLGLENYILKHAHADKMRANVYTGPYFGDGDLEHASGAKISLAFWKVVAIVTEDGRPSATAYRVSQEQELGELEFVFAGYEMYQVSVQQVMNNTRIDFSALVEYDGFSQHEWTGGGPVEERLDSLQRVRV